MKPVSITRELDGETVTARSDDGRFFYLENDDNELCFRWSDASGVWLYLSDGPPTVTAETVQDDDWEDIPEGSRELLEEVRNAVSL